MTAILPFFRMLHVSVVPNFTRLNNQKISLSNIREQLLETASQLVDVLNEVDTVLEMLFIRSYYKEVSGRQIFALVERAGRELHADAKRQHEWAGVSLRVDFTLVPPQKLYRQLLAITNARQHTKPERILLIEALLLAVVK